MSLSATHKQHHKQYIADILCGMSGVDIRRMMEDHRFFYHWMMSTFPTRPAAAVALHQAIREGITKDIGQYQSLSSVLAERFARRLSAQTGLTIEWSLWAVKTWSKARGVDAKISARGAVGVGGQVVRRPNQGLLQANRPKVLELKGHRKTLTDIVYSPNGRWTATSSLDRSIRLWDVRTGKMLARFLAGHRDWIRTLVFHPDGRQLCSGGDDGALRLWDLTNGRKLNRIPVSQGWVRTVSYSHDGRLLAAGSQDGMVCIWSAESLELLQRLGPFGRSINRISFTYDGTALAIAMQGQIDIWQLRSSTRLYRRSVRGDRTSVLTLPDGGVLLASKEGLQRMEIDDPEAVIQFVGHKGAVWGMCLDPNGPTVASFGADRSIRFWDARTGLSLWKMDMKTAINAVGISSTGRLGVALSSNKGWLWELERRK